MPFYLKNDKIKLTFLKPGEIYKGSRFDWTGQIAQITYLGKHTFCTKETLEPNDESQIGQGLYNEFGIDKAVGYDDCKVGETFPKIGVGQLTRNSNDDYIFYQPYKIKPYKVEIEEKDNSVLFVSKANSSNGYSFTLVKEITLKESGFVIMYQLENTGEKEISTHEYVHNFLAIDNIPLNNTYELSFPFEIDKTFFSEYVNPENALKVDLKSIFFTKIPKKMFFIGHLSREISLGTSWTLKNDQAGLSITENLKAPVLRVNLWGLGHVISPEIFYKINAKPGKTEVWAREYSISKINK